MEWQFQEASVPHYEKRGHSPEAGKRKREYKRAWEKTRKRSYSVDPRERRMIAWDGEGMKLSGPHNPQHYVLFGCSAEPESPLVIEQPKGDLTFQEIADYLCDVAERYPKAFHVGYYFAYDQNMIVKHLSAMHKMILHEKNTVQVRRGESLYRIKWIPKKRITITRVRHEKKVSITIDDMAAFFASSFVEAYRGLFPEDENSAAFARVIEGKQERADMLFSDMARVREYWESEIILLERLAERFRSVMYDAGFMLREWYGPGALANLIRREYGLAVHEWGGKEANMPPAVHEASKRAYFGGRFEQFKAGRIRGPIYAYDIRSAYPAAFTQLPSLREGGIWRHVEQPNPGVRFGVYRLRYRQEHVIPWKPQPLPHRCARMGNVTFPGMVDGWYWAPEAAAAVRHYRAELLEGWEWWPAEKEERPWALFETMFQHRARLKRMGNPMEMAFKLGPNSMYGKMAQRIGFDAEAGTPPRAHTLPIAGWITAYCRAEILALISQMDWDSIIAVETDGVFSTCPPDQLRMTIGNGLGEWEVKQCDEMIYVQSGVYLCKSGGKWKSKTRGMDAASITYDTIISYLRTLHPNAAWEPLELPQRERFLGLGAAIARAGHREKQPNPFKLAALHCRWETKPRMLGLGEKGKRIHIPDYCPACAAEQSAAQGTHQLVVHSPASQLNPVSAPYLLPWEKGYTEPEWLALDREAENEIRREEV